MKAYEESLKVYRDNYSIIANAKKERDIEIAKEMKKEGLSVDQIARITGLAKEQIEKL